MSDEWASRPRSGRVRLFVAGELPAEVQRAISDWQERELSPRDDLRITRSVHLTLCFLGHLDQDAVPAVTDALAEVRFAPVPLAITETLFLPGRRLKRVVAVRVDDPTGGLVALQAEVSDALARTGLYTPERRPYTPHATVARYRRDGHPFPLHNVTFSTFLMDRLVLYSSLLERGGAVHTPVAVFPAA
jgi:2'-5' RNA ligase